MFESLKSNIKSANLLQIEGRAFINGEYINQRSVQKMDCFSPIDHRLLKQVDCCGLYEVNLAVTSAKDSFQSGVWSKITPSERKNVLKKWAELLHNNREELILLETLDTGKPISDVMNIDFPQSIQCLEWFAELIDKINDEIIPDKADYICMVTREPIGVVAAIIPWNYPLLMAIWKIAPALAMGNSILLKPSEKTPLTAIKIAQFAAEAGLPPGVLNVLTGGGEVGSIMSYHEDVDCVSFTGSGRIGRKIMQASAQSNLKRVWLELGGKSPNIIMPDYPDLKNAAKSAASAVFSNTGAICNAGSRLLVHQDIKDIFLECLFEEANHFNPGNPLDLTTRMGPVIDEHHFKFILDSIRKGKKEASLIYGGKQVLHESGGFYLEPTIFECSNNDKYISREEIFGPVLSVMTFKTFDEALKIANSTNYGLAAAIWTIDMNYMLRGSKELRAGMVYVNNYEGISNLNLPFGGYKQSGFGRDNSKYALDKYSELKSTVIHLK